MTSETKKSDTAHSKTAVRLLNNEETLAVGAGVLAKLPGGGPGWYAGTVVGVAGTSGSETYRVVFVDGTVLESINRTSLRVWSRPVEMPWHKRRLALGVATFANECYTSVCRQNGQACPALGSSQRSVEQLDVKTRDPLSRWPSAKRACEKMTWIPGPEDIVACCRGMTPQAGGYGWRFAEAKSKIDAADVDELLSINAAIMFQQVNPKRAGTKSHDLYELYKKAKTVREMLSLGGRRADISYDLTHGWLKFQDPELTRRFVIRVKSVENGPKVLLEKKTEDHKAYDSLL